MFQTHRKLSTARTRMDSGLNKISLRHICGGAITIQSILEDSKERFVYFIDYMSPEQVDVVKIFARDWIAENSLRNYGNKKTRDD